MSDRAPDLFDLATGAAPSPDDPSYNEWLERVAFSPEGVDSSQILEHLRRTPSERLEVLERVVNDLLELRGGRWPELP